MAANVYYTKLESVFSTLHAQGIQTKKSWMRRSIRRFAKTSGWQRVILLTTARWQVKTIKAIPAMPVNCAL